MSVAKANTVLLRYELEEHREAFVRDFAQTFTIICHRSDEEAIASLAEGQAAPDALVFITENAEQVVGSELLRRASADSRCFRMVISDRISLDQIIHLLDDRVIDRCYTMPWDSNLIRADLFAATMALHDATISTPATSPDNRPLVLIVDDEQSATKYLSKQLMRMQDRFDIRCAASAGEALTILRQEGDRVAALMTDQRMPGMKGLQLINEMRHSFPYTTRILTSAYGELDVALGAVNQGRIFRYQKKPWHAASLLPVLEDAIARHRTLRQKAEQSQLALDARFRDTREQRKEALIKALAEPAPGAVAAQDLIRRFLADMESVSTLPPGASHFRADHPAALDAELARGLRAELARYLDLFSTDVTADGSQPPEAIQPALDVLLAASGLGRESLTTEQGDGTRTLGLKPGKALHMYSHVLSPLAGVSSQLLKQQGALLAIYLWCAKAGGKLSLQGGQQRFTLVLSLPSPSGSNHRQ